ncbi:MAG: hypothetical protein IH872_12110 [Chloroflexi bacterium]|nr:hypothetical protein [Chloroflexota bacterium]
MDPNGANGGFDRLEFQRALFTLVSRACLRDAQGVESGISQAPNKVADREDVVADSTIFNLQKYIASMSIEDLKQLRLKLAHAFLSELDTQLAMGRLVDP